MDEEIVITNNSAKQESGSQMEMQILAVAIPA
jgi:hypothetical protein